MIKKTARNFVQAFIQKPVQTLVMISLVITTVGCSSGMKKVNVPPEVTELAPLTISEPVVLTLKATVGGSETVKYFNRSFTRTFDRGEIRHEKEETLEFTARAKTVAVVDSEFTQVVETIAKDGQGDLRFFALPELGEKVEIVTRADGTVVRAGGYPSNSIFYVPPISLPKEAVRVGDTWTMQATWVTLADGQTPFMSDMVSILKGFKKCGTSQCAEIEVSGEVFMPEALQKQLGFRSTWRGYLLFDIQQGTVLWSRTDSSERYSGDSAARSVAGCMEALLVQPESVRLPGKETVACSVSL